MLTSASKSRMTKYFQDIVCLKSMDANLLSLEIFIVQSFKLLQFTTISPDLLSETYYIMILAKKMLLGRFKKKKKHYSSQMSHNTFQISNFLPNQTGYFADQPFQHCYLQQQALQLFLAISSAIIPLTYKLPPHSSHPVSRENTDSTTNSILSRHIE